MKKISVLFAAILMFATIGMKAQKMATLDVASILNAMPEKKKADAQIKAFSDAKASELQKKSEAFKALYEKYSNEAKDQTDATNKTREAELKQNSETLKKIDADAQKELYDKQDAAFAPIEAKFNAAVSKVAKANGWDYIMDVNSSSLVYKNGPDATAAVKKELGQ